MAASSSWLAGELPAAVLQSLQYLSHNSSDPLCPTSSPVSSLWTDVAAYFPLVSLWPLALLLSLLALNILAILLLGTWRLAKSNLCFSQVFSFSYAGRERKLRLPGDGAVLALALVASAAQVAEVVRWGTWGRLGWLDPVSAYARTAAFVCLWLAVLFVALSSIQTIPLLSDAASSTAIPRSLACPVLHPVLVDCLVWGLPLLICLVPCLALLSRSQGSITAFEAVLSQSLASSGNGTVALPTAEALSAGFGGVLQGCKMQGYARALALLVLLGVLALNEARARSRLGKVATVLREAEDSVLSSAPGGSAYDYEPEYLPVLARTYSQHSHSSAFSCCSYSSSGKKHLFLPEKVQLDLPSPSLLREADLEYPYSYSYPAPAGPRCMSRASSSERSATPARSMSRQSLLLPQMVRARSYASSRSGCSSCSGEKAYHSKPYAGSSSLQVGKQRSARLVEALVLGGVLLLSCIFEGAGAALKEILLEDRRLDAAFEVAVKILQIVPLLAGLVLSAVRDNGPAYGWSGTKG